MGADARTILKEAESLVSGPRQAAYGTPWDSLEGIGRAWTPYVEQALAKKGFLDGTDVANLMIILKAMRTAVGYHHDSFVDIAGYARIAQLLNDPDARAAFIALIQGEGGDGTCSGF